MLNDYTTSKNVTHTEINKFQNYLKNYFASFKLIDYIFLKIVETTILF